MKVARNRSSVVLFWGGTIISAPPFYILTKCVQDFPLLCTLEAKVTGALETQVAPIPFHQQTILLTGDMELHPIAAFHLKCHIIGSGSMMMTVHAAMTMTGHIRPLCDNGCRYGQSGRMIILVPLADSFHQYEIGRAHV